MSGDDPTGRVARRPRVGTGVDVHPFEEGRPLWIAGLEWPGETGLSGHSDGDVAAHAACDALLAAGGLGDLGSVFGTSDPRWSVLPASTCSREAARLVGEAGYAIGNVSVQVIGTAAADRDATRRGREVALGGGRGPGVRGGDDQRRSGPDRAR